MSTGRREDRSSVTGVGQSFGNPRSAMSGNHYAIDDDNVTPRGRSGIVMNMRAPKFFTALMGIAGHSLGDNAGPIL